MQRPVTARAACVSALIALILCVVSHPAYGKPAPPKCGAFVAKVYNQIDPRMGSQSLTSEGDSAVTAYAAGFTSVKNSYTAAVSPGSSLVAVHTLRKNSNGNLFYSYNKAEIKAATASGYKDQGIAFYASSQAAGCLQPVYSFYRTGGHHRFVSSSGERAQLKREGWKEERVRFYLGKGANVFSLAVYPDTQQEVLQERDSRLLNRSQWVVDTAPLLNTKYVLHTGDIVNWANSSDNIQYQRLARGIQPLNGRLFYSFAAGNHDTAAVGSNGAAVDPPNTSKLVRHTNRYNEALRDQMRVTSEFEPGRAENSYSLFSAGGLNWMVLTLELWPRKEVIAWARKAVAAHPKHNVVVVTHSYLSSNGTLSPSNGGYGSTSPKYLYDNLIKVYPNIKMTFSGHTGTAAYRRDVGVKGNVIHSYLLAMHSNTTNPTRLVEINASAGVVSSWVYAPFTKTPYPAYYRAPAAVSWVR